MSFSHTTPITFHDIPIYDDLEEDQLNHTHDHHTGPEQEQQQQQQQQHQQPQPQDQPSLTNTDPTTTTSTLTEPALATNSATTSASASASTSANAFAVLSTPPRTSSSSVSSVSRARNASRASQQDSLPMVSEDGSHFDSSDGQPAIQLDEKWSQSPALARMVNMYHQRVGLFDHTKPAHNAHVIQHSFRVSVIGVSGSGKSTTVAHMCGDSVPYKHVETAGIHVNTVHWPIRILDQAGDATIHLCSLSLWDAGHASCQLYGYLNQQLLPSSPSAVPFDACMYVCSAMEWGSYKWVQSKLDDDISRTFAKIVVMTKCDQFLRHEVAEQDLLSLADTHKDIHLCKIANLPLSKEKFYQKPEVVSLLNLLCFALVGREREQASADSIAPYVSRSMTPPLMGMATPPSPKFSTMPALQPILPAPRVTQSMAVGTTTPNLRRSATSTAVNINKR